MFSSPVSNLAGLLEIWGVFDTPDGRRWPCRCVYAEHPVTGAREWRWRNRGVGSGAALLIARRNGTLRQCAGEGVRAEHWSITPDSVAKPKALVDNIKDALAAPTFGSLGERFGLQGLIGKRLAIISDARLGGRVDAATVVENVLRLVEECE